MATGPLELPPPQAASTEVSRPSTAAEIVIRRYRPDRAQRLGKVPTLALSSLHRNITESSPHHAALVNDQNVRSPLGSRNRQAEILRFRYVIATPVVPRILEKQD